MQPGFVQGMVQYLGFDDRAAGHVASAEMFGIAATTVAMTFAAHRVNWRSVGADLVAHDGGDQCAEHRRHGA